MRTSRVRHLPVLLLAIAMALPATASDWSHPPLEVRKKGIRAGTGKEAVEIADVTAHCLECHGPDIGAAEAEAAAPTPVHSVGGADRSHPVDVVYPKAGQGLTPRGTLDERLLLIEGRMTCVTCHAPEAADHALVIPEAGSQLCIACHQR